VLEPIDHTCCMLHTGAYSLETIAIHLSFLGVDFQIHEPPELLEHIRSVADRLKRAVSDVGHA